MGRRPGSRIEALLEELCVEYGYCISDADRARIVDNPPPDPDAFLTEVFLVEGRDATDLDLRDRAELVRLIDDWLFGTDGRGTESKLP